MLCKNPYTIGVSAFGCGQCMPCRLNRRRLWTHRMFLESLKHEQSSFITLTYDQDHVPKDLSLNPKHTTDWVKRLRDKISPRKVRYFLVGEYGDHTQRPHYHAALFGVGLLDEELIKDTWKKGFIQVGELTLHSAQYIAGYVTKKMTQKEDSRLKGRHPEFARMSRKPGIGATAMDEVADILTTHFGVKEIETLGDVPKALKQGKKSLPLGRYLRSKLREKLGFKETSTPKESLRAWQEMLLEVYTDAIQDPQNPKGVKALLLKQNHQKILNLETRAKIFNKKGEL